MPDNDLIDGLVGTYRTLNIDVRRTPESQLQAMRGGTSAREVLKRMRDDELRFSQGLKARLTGVEFNDTLGAGISTIGSESDDDTTAAIIAQFGTARESTLAQLRGLPDAEWDQTLENGKSIRTRVLELVDHDRKQLDQIVGLIGAS